MDFHTILWKSQFLTNVPRSGCSETLICLRKNNDLGAGPPKDPLLAKITGKLRNLPFVLILGGNSPKRAEKVILGGFYGFRADRTPPGPMNLLCIAMVWEAFGRPGARRGAFPTFYVKIMENHKNNEISEIAWNFRKFHDNHKIHGKSLFLSTRRLQNLDIPWELLVFLQCHGFHEFSLFHLKIEKSVICHLFYIFEEF